MLTESQKVEVYRATSRGADELSLAQVSIGLCDQCISEASTANPDREWLSEHIGDPMFKLYGAHDTYILNGEEQPVYAFSKGKQGLPSSYHDPVAPAVNRFVKLARGEAKRPSGRSNLNERLPGSPPEPLVVPPQPGLRDYAMTVYPTVRTGPDVVHSTDLARIGDRVAIVSAMIMARGIGAKPAEIMQAPVLINIRFLDEQFLREAERQFYLSGARLADSGRPRGGEASAQIADSDGTPLTTIFWKPFLAGSVVIKGLLPPAAAMLGVITLMLLLLALRMRQLMRKDEAQMSQLEQAHLELTAKEAQAQHLANHDVLTGLPNRAFFNDKAEQALIRARDGEMVAILLLDLDRFKNVNDRFGHLAGDALIKEVARRLTGVLGHPDSVARLGGDEFAMLLLPEDRTEDISNTLDRVLECLHHPFDVLGNQAYVGVSIGVALAPNCGSDRTELMRKADIALYRAKADGRDCYRFFSESMDETVQLRAALETDLRAALSSSSGLCVHYQPLVDSESGEVTGMEALLRWDHPARGWIPAHIFVPIAEETGLICQLGDWVLTEVCQVAKQWPDRSIAVNLSAIQFCDENFAERTCTMVRDAGVRAGQIEFEVTESIVLDQNDNVRGALRRLRSEGFRIALDDFGTGYSSLSYLRDFEVDRIKIDRSFIHNIGESVDAGAIVTAVVTLGHAMGLQVTAEGVETSAQEQFLKAAGCNVLQGFLFSHAVPSQHLSSSVPSGTRVRLAASAISLGPAKHVALSS
jgi:diguanylate cyclase (GGDEF)-like protein